MNCEAVYERSGVSRHARPVPAKRIVLRNYPSARVAVNAKTGADESATIHQKQANNGRWVVIEEAVCGMHERSLQRNTITIPAEVLGQMSWEGILDYAVRVYERKEAEAAERAAAESARYAKHRQDEYDLVTFTVTEDIERGDIAGWLIWAIDPERPGDNRRVAHVSVEVSEGRPWVRLGEYMNSGRGRGSAHYTGTLIDVYQRALGEAQKWTKRNTMQPGSQASDLLQSVVE